MDITIVNVRENCGRRLTDHNQAAQAYPDPQIGRSKYGSADQDKQIGRSAD